MFCHQDGRQSSLGCVKTPTVLAHCPLTWLPSWKNLKRLIWAPPFRYAPNNQLSNQPTPADVCLTSKHPNECFKTFSGLFSSNGSHYQPNVHALTRRSAASSSRAQLDPWVEPTTFVSLKQLCALTTSCVLDVVCGSPVEGRGTPLV